MQTSFTLAQLADPDIEAANGILRSCVHCGFCLATCPTYLLLGDELDSPRGRIYLMKSMLEEDRAADAETTTHIDRCLSCLACMTTCPSGVHYMHLVDIGRAHIEKTRRRPFLDRALRAVLAHTMPFTGRFRAALLGAALLRPLRFLVGGRLRAMLALAPAMPASRSSMEGAQVFPAQGMRRARVALLEGCVQPALKPAINEATIRLLTRHGIEVVQAPGAACCGSLAHHMGRQGESHAQAKANIDAWLREADENGLDAILVNASGCGTTLKDYGFMFRADPLWATKAARVSALAKDVTEFLVAHGIGEPSGARERKGIAVAYHSACSMQHGQKIHREPRDLLRKAGFEVREIPDGHLCCGSAGTYNILQSDLADDLRARKASNIAKTGADILATGNIGCIAQLERAVGMPVVHTVELLDWATGGPKPATLTSLG
ncbi:MAG: glycolate oxidase subunit GlcF [Rhodospirillaceae bacterium]|nr:glycolate oxidase subunit GlcF [Rhodospirillaceae bacterium]